ncbi:MAG: TonB-dependent receptor [Desulfobacteraceae bacterium]|nr:TonB-dependent receptor [Desulfobacteraceae bacterium]MCB9494155.1 TonB-dependent receptor [Desulfobacteraceae bacterium]
MAKIFISGFFIVFLPLNLLAGDYDGKKESEKELKIEEIKVTATKQEENIQDISQSISVFISRDIEDLNIESMSDIADMVPNFMLFDNGTSGLNSPSIRGIHVAPHTLTSTAGLFVDGIPVTSGAGFEESLVDIERIEVLRGPQGTLYGKNTESGAINIITRQPGNDFRGSVSLSGGKLLSAEAGDKNTGSLSLGMTGPIKEDRLFFGLAGKYFKKDGFIENTVTKDTVDDREHWYGRGHLRFTPSEKLDISFIASRLEYDDGGPNMTLGKQGAAAFGLPEFEKRKVSSDYEGANTAVSDSQVLKVDFDITDNLHFTSITSRRVYDDESRADWDFTQNYLMHTEKNGKYAKKSQEMRLAYLNDRMKWLIGFYYDNDENDLIFETFSAMPQTAGKTNRKIEGDSLAWFANMTFPVSAKANIVSGIRWEKQFMDFKDNMDQRKANDSWTSISPRLGLEYYLKDKIMTYASISKGYRSGGFNFFSLNPDYYTYDDESLWNYEVGIKSSLFNDRLIMNASVYYMDIKDMQVEEALDHLETYMTNAAEATGKGFEAEISARVTRGFSVFAGFGYNDVTFDKFEDANGNYKNNTNPYAPEYTYNIGGKYRHHTGLFARLDLTGCGKIYFDKENEQSRDSYELVNAKIGYETERFDIYIYGENIFDKEYDSEGYYGGMYTIYSEPGEVGMKVSCRF